MKICFRRKFFTKWIENYSTSLNNFTSRTHVYVVSKTQCLSIAISICMRVLPSTILIELIEMYCFGIIKTNLAKCFYFPNQTQMFSVNRLMFIVKIFWLGVSQFLFLFCEADGIIETVSTAYMTVASFGIFMSLIHTIFKTEFIYKLMDCVSERVITRSE